MSSVHFSIQTARLLQRSFNPPGAEIDFNSIAQIFCRHGTLFTETASCSEGFVAFIQTVTASLFERD